jgi:hypothetical protein
MHGSRRKIPGKKSRPYIYDVKFLNLLGAPYTYDILRLTVKATYDILRLRVKATYDILRLTVKATYAAHVYVCIFLYKLVRSAGVHFPYMAYGFGVVG